MDPISDLPPMTTEPPPHMVHAANPSPPLATNNVHPPYPEMIIAAITALNDKEGSSRQAIAKYIEKEYTSLPPTHNSLLTHHLKRLKNQGALMMVKHSYMLPPPRSGPFQPPTTAAYHPTLDYSDTSATETTSLLPKRKPGRPPKARPDSGFEVQHNQQNVQAFNASTELPPYQPQFQMGSVQDYQTQTQFGAAGQDLQLHFGGGQDNQGNSVGGAEPIFVSLGLADDGVAGPMLQSSEHVEVAKRGRGRPPKVSGRSAVAGSDGGVAGSGGGEDVAVPAGDSVLGKRRRGRPAGRPKSISVMMGNGGGVKKGRGRPKRIGIGAVTVPLSGNVMRPRGRPKKAAGRPSGRPAQNVPVNGVGNSGLISRRPGRPPKSGGASKARKLIGKSLGNHSKTGPGTAVLVTDPQQLVAYQELKFKYEHLQSKAKQVVSVVKPYINPDYGTAALGALQELEVLAGTEANVQPQGEIQEPLPFVQN